MDEKNVNIDVELSGSPGIVTRNSYKDSVVVWKKPGNEGEILSEDKSVGYAEYFRPKFEEIIDVMCGIDGLNGQQARELLDELIKCLKNPEEK